MNFGRRGKSDMSPDSFLSQQSTSQDIDVRSPLGDYITACETIGRHTMTPYPVDLWDARYIALERAREVLDGCVTPFYKD